MIVGALVIASTSVAAAFEAAPYSAFEIPTGQTIKMRSNPLDDAQVVAEIPHTANDIVLTGKFGGDWVNIDYRGANGWVWRGDIGLGMPGKFQIPSVLICSSGSEWIFHMTPAMLTFEQPGKRSFFVTVDAQENPGKPGLLTTTHRSPLDRPGVTVVFVRNPDNSITAAPSTRPKNVGNCRTINNEQSPK
jgi:hypothetical protein